MKRWMPKLVARAIKLRLHRQNVRDDLARTAVAEVLDEDVPAHGRRQP